MMMQVIHLRVGKNFRAKVGKGKMEEKKIKKDCNKRKE